MFEEYKRAMRLGHRPLPRREARLSADDEKLLRESFKAIRSTAVGITGSRSQIDPGERATVPARSRQDVINGRPTKAVLADLPARAGGLAWQIR